MTTIIVDGGQTTTYRQMMPDVRAHIPQIVDFMAVASLAKSAREFFERSYSWRAEDATLLTTVAGQALYTFSAQLANTDLWAIHQAQVLGRDIGILQPGDQYEVAIGSASDTFAVGVADQQTFRVSPAPLSAGTIVKGAVSYVPSEGATGISAALWRRYRRGIAHGAVAFAVMEPDKPWSNPQMYGYHRSIFEEEVTWASNEAGTVRRDPIRATPR